MILEHELPEGSKLYFAKSAKLRRSIESKAMKILYENDYKEIITPIFSYLSHQHDFSDRNMIRLSAKDNQQVILRYDSTIDAVRIITKRISRSMDHNKWFYIQPVYDYPTREVNQIGVEHLNNTDINSILCLCISIIRAFDLSPSLQICNQKVSLLCAQELGMSINEFINPDIEKLYKRGEFLKKLVFVHTKKDLEDTIRNTPAFLHEELEIMLSCAESCKYENMVFSPLFCAPGNYYQGLFYRMFSDNQILAIGGKYNILDINSCGFAIYTDNVIKQLLKGKAWQI